jgi:hypothetical protein
MNRHSISCSLARAAVLALAFAPLMPSLRAEVFTLADKQGRSIKADVIEIAGEQVKIKRDDGQMFTIPMSALAADDQDKLNAWATKESKKSLPPGALQVEMNRGNFKTIKVDSDVTLTTGTVVKNGRTTTEEKWGYAITIANKTPKPIDNLRAEYRLFATVDSVHVKEKQGLKKKKYQSPIDNIPELSRIEFRTETISAFKMKYNGNIVSSKTGDSSSRETLTGIWIRIYRGDELVYENATPDKLRTTETW